MKKLCLLFTAVIIMVFAAGCNSAPAPAQSGLPKWFAELPPDDTIWGVGIAKLANETLALETATTRAQRDAARQLSALVQAELIDYANESGLSTDPRSIISIENVSRSLINLNLSNTSINAREQGSDGTWYVRVSVKKTDVTRQVNSIVENEFADFADFKADEALKRVDTTINITQFRTEGLSE